MKNGEKKFAFLYLHRGEPYIFNVIQTRNLHSFQQMFLKLLSV